MHHSLDCIDKVPSAPPDLCCRTEYLGKTLDSVAGLDGLDRVTVYVSQDGQDTAVADLVQQVGRGALAPPHTSFFEHWQRDRIPQLGPNQASYMAYASIPS